MEQDHADMVNDLFNHQIRPLLEAQNEAIRRLQRELTLREEEIMQLEQRVAVLEGAPPVWHGGEGRDQPAPALTERDYAHHQLAQRFTSIFEQRIVPLAETFLDRHPPATDDDFKNKAELIANLCLAFFGRPFIDRDRLNMTFGDDLVAEVSRVCGQVDELRAEAANSGLQLWDFDYDDGRIPDPSRQLIWHGCSDSVPVDFVIAPAYVALNRNFSRQIVFTEKASVPKRSTGGWLPRLLPRLSQRSPTTSDG